MKIARRASLLLAATALASGALALRGHAVRAQIDPMRMSFAVYESRSGDAPVLVGELFREGADPSRYTEHWVLAPGYVSPGSGVVMELRPGLRSYRDARDFLSRAAFPQGSRYVHVDCLDSTERPTAR